MILISHNFAKQEHADLMCALVNGPIHLAGNLTSFYTHGLFLTFKKTKMGVISMASPLFQPHTVYKDG